MPTDKSVSIRLATEDDRKRLSSMIHLEPRVHRHLDWRPPLDWIGSQFFLVALQYNQIIAALACPPDPPSIAWVRIFVSSRLSSHKDMWEILWPDAKNRLQEMKTQAIAAIPLQKWFRELLIEKGYKHIHNVIVFAWDNIQQDNPQSKPIKIRGMHEDELPAIQEIDEIAFGPLWRNSLDSIILAFKQAKFATVAEDQTGQPIGFQISTPTPYGAHLARLAVRPSAQNQGVGYALTKHLQNHLKGSLPFRLSVNTQDHNKTSIALYNKAGFVQVDEAYPVYLYDFED